MKQRCLNPRHAEYADYGGRGITVCDRWLNSFEAFLKDMGPSNGLTLDRINNNAGYSKDNCRWTTQSVQNRNRRKMKGCSSIYRGVSRAGRKWRAYITPECGPMIWLGQFDTELEAARAYDEASLRLFGRAVPVNFPDAAQDLRLAA
ncbi:MAG TPA: AP2/ERF family transcription factor [Bryobacteraceae bacterium]|nr:AP2/ERF family transcription factor [Bryobacteraceae bacterium]